MKRKAFSSSEGDQGFTLIEILVVIGLIAVLAAVVIIAINPARQFAQGRNSQRMSNVTSLLNAIGQNIADNKGVFTCATPGAVIDDTVRKIEYVAVATVGSTDLRPCMVPTYISEIPYDPSYNNGAAHVTSASDYNTEYTITRDVATQRITVCAPGGAEPSIAGSTAICQTR
jgi:type IV pilus assembly protein PilA